MTLVKDIDGTNGTISVFIGAIFVNMFKQPVTLPSDRKFGFFFGFVFAVVALASAFFYGNLVLSLIALAVCVAFLITALTKPSVLRRLNRSWAYLGLILGMIISPIVLGLIYFGMFTPLATILRLKGRDELRLKNKQRESYWIVRDPVGPSPESFKDQH